MSFSLIVQSRLRSKSLPRQLGPHREERLQVGTVARPDGNGLLCMRIAADRQMLEIDSESGMDLRFTGGGWSL